MSASGTPMVEIVIAEELDAKAAERLHTLLGDAMALRPNQLIIDLSDCPFIHAVAVEVLLDAHRRVWQTGGRLTLRSPSPRLRRILRAARVDHVFHITQSPPLQSPAHARPPRAPAGPGRQA